ncbi:MAG: secondary thiamine-phosphate synthase enzyme YjbQ [Pseudomonadota bacterium]
MIIIETSGQGLYEFTDEAQRFVAKRTAGDAVLTIFIQHTSASLLIQENADPTVMTDLNDFFSQIAPEGNAYHHNTEGPDDMPAHIKAALTAASLTIPVQKGRPALGTWQGLFLFEHRRAAHTRRVLCALSPCL